MSLRPPLNTSKQYDTSIWRHVIAQLKDKFVVELSYDPLPAITNESTMGISGPPAANVNFNAQWLGVGSTVSPAAITFVENGLQLQPAAAANASCWIQPFLGSANFHGLFVEGNSSWASVAFRSVFNVGTTADTDKGRGIEFHAVIRTGSSVATLELVAGLQAGVYNKIGMASSTTAANTKPDDGAYHYMRAGLNNNEINGAVNFGSTDEVNRSGIVLQANTDYLLSVQLNNKAEPIFSINGVSYKTGSALDDSLVVIPVIGVKDSSTTQLGCTVRGMVIAKSWQ